MMAKSEGVGMSPEEEMDLSWMNLDNEEDILPKVKRGRGKLILLEDIIKEKNKKLKAEEKEKKKKGQNRKKAAKKKQDLSCSSSDDEDSTSDDADSSSDEVSRIKSVEDDLDQMLSATTGVQIAIKWGEGVFGPQKPFTVFTIPGNDTGLISRVLKFKPQEGVESISTVASMASNGLLLSWAVLEGRCDETSVRWLFHQMAYSNNDSVVKGACKMLCDLLKTTDGKPICTLEWLPSFEDIIHAFRLYGYLDACDEDSMQADEPFDKTDMRSQGEDDPLAQTGSGERRVPPSNMRSLLKFLVPYIEPRRLYNTLSTSEAEGLVAILTRCQLDRCMLSVSNLLGSCFEALIYYFTEEEWTSSCERIASTISRISSIFVNNMRVAQSLHATNSRLGSLQKLVVLQLLSSLAQKQIFSPEDVVSIFKGMKVKEVSCNLVKLHHLLVLADIYLWSDSSATRTKKVYVQWLDYLKKYSSQIRTQDTRQDAMKVRNWASFLSQKYQIEKMQTNSASAASQACGEAG